MGMAITGHRHQYSRLSRRPDRLVTVILAKAFHGKLVPQDPAAALARIGAERGDKHVATRRRSK